MKALLAVVFFSALTGGTQGDPKVLTGGGQGDPLFANGSKVKPPVLNINGSGNGNELRLVAGGNGSGNEPSLLLIAGNGEGVRPV